MLEPRFSPFPILTTNRLLLRQITQADAAEIFELRSSPEVMKYIGKKKAQTIQDALDFIQAVQESLVADTGISWAIALLENPAKLIGYIGHWRLMREHYRSEIGYMLLPAYQKRGLMKEALLKVLDYGFNEMKLHSVEAHIYPKNTASANILESTGFIREGYFKENFFFEGVFDDTAVYSKLKTG
jgi:[ribosomal protein S5]-alanine N-acetyltransferase